MNGTNKKKVLDSKELCSGARHNENQCLETETR